MNHDSITLISTEMSSVWTSYLNDSMSKYALAYFQKDPCSAVIFVHDLVSMDKEELMENKTKGDSYGN
ncbi:hypothetical protein [Ectobacillus funiculus]|uniref:Uncharacterized protein n=1 Tax=Ectobacillus funiculus TaxID=137993 RepID=A0ABV5WCL6_9BACI